MLTPEQREFIKAYITYFTIVEACVLTVSAVGDNSFSEHVARNWMLLLVFIASPIHKGLPFIKSILLSIVFVLPSMLAQMYVAYGLKGYSGTDPISTPMLIASLGYYAGVTFAGWLVAKQIYSSFVVLSSARPQ